MKIDRLIGILSILLQQEKVTAPYLAEKFEVSRRTINRDIEVLCKAGIPLVTTQGQGGGISIMNGFRIDRTVLSSAEMQSILTGLKSLDSVSGTHQYQQLMEKLSAGTSATLTAGSHIVIDLASWYKSSLAPKIELIQNAIETSRYIHFHYCSPRGENEKTAEPYLLVFQWSSWYAWGYCTEQRDFRMFKLNRMTDLAVGSPHHAAREIPDYHSTVDQAFPILYRVTGLCEPELRWKLTEEYGDHCYQVQDDGRLLFQLGFTDRNYLIGWVLGMGSQVEILEPDDLREELAIIAKQIYQKYTSR